MSAEVRRIALASPTPSDPPRFAVGGQLVGQGTPNTIGDVKMFEWLKGRGEMRMTGIETDIGQIRAMVWSPSPSYPNLLAVGLSTGKTHLLNLSPSSLSLQMTQTENPTPILHIKHSRAITALSFCPTDPSYLACGLERHRSDASLLIWDIHDAISNIPPTSPATRPGDRLEITNPLAIHSRPSDTRHIQSFCPGEQVNSTAFMYHGYTLLASTNTKQIRLWDLRSPSMTGGTSSPREGTGNGGAGAVWATRAVYGLTPNQERPEMFASWDGGSTGAVKLWDTRKTGEVMSMEVGTGIVGLQWTDRGLAVGSKEGGVTFWDVIKGRQFSPEGDMEEWTTIAGTRQVVKPKQNLHSFAYAPSEFGGDVMYVLKDGTIGVGPVTPIPAIATSSEGDLAIGTSSLKIMSSDSQTLLELPQTKINDDEEAPSRGQHQLTPERVSQLIAEADQTRERNQSVVRAFRELRFPSNITSDSENTRAGPSELRNVAKLQNEEIEGSMGEDIGLVMQRRAEEGYGLRNPLMNGVIASRYPYGEELSSIWHFVNHLTATLDSTTTYKSYNLAHAGILSIWSGLGFSGPSNLGSSPISIRSGSTLHNEPSQSHQTVREPIRQGSSAWSSLKPQTSSTSATTHPPSPSPSYHGGSSSSGKVVSQLPNPDNEWTNILGEICHQKGYESGSFPRLPSTDRLSARKIILAVCAGGLVGDLDEQFEPERSKLAARAYFANDEEKAIKVLLQSSNPKHRLTGATLATSMSRPATRKVNQSDWVDVINSIDDAYIRAILRRVGGEGWDSILQEDIDLLDKIALAVCNLSDQQLSEFFQKLYTQIQLRPQLSHLPLTGLTHLAIPILQNNIDLTGDIQSATLLAGYIPPSKIGSSNQAILEKWNEGYRDLLDSWRMWSLRSEYDVQRLEWRKKLGGGGDGVEGETARGFCPVCNHVLSKQSEEFASRKNAIRGTMSWPNERTPTCGFCGNALPRCVVCLQLVESRFGSTPHDDDYSRLDGKAQADTIDSAYVCCQTCRHGGHANHVLSWFMGGLDGESGHDVCPVKGCGCECASL